MAKYTITANVTFEVEADTSEDASVKAFCVLEWEHPEPENIMVWDENPAHWFAKRYTYANPPVLIEPNPQGPQALNKPKAEAKDQVGSIA